MKDKTMSEATEQDTEQGTAGQEWIDLLAGKDIPKADPEDAQTARALRTIFQARRDVQIPSVKEYKRWKSKKYKASEHNIPLWSFAVAVILVVVAGLPLWFSQNFDEAYDASEPLKLPSDIASWRREGVHKDAHSQNSGIIALSEPLVLLLSKSPEERIVEVQHIRHVLEEQGIEYEFVNKKEPWELSFALPESPSPALMLFLSQKDENSLLKAFPDISRIEFEFELESDIVTESDSLEGS